VSPWSLEEDVPAVRLESLPVKQPLVEAGTADAKDAGDEAAPVAEEWQPGLRDRDRPATASPFALVERPPAVAAPAVTSAPPARISVAARAMDREPPDIEELPLRFEEEQEWRTRALLRSYRTLILVALGMFVFTVLTWIYLFDHDLPEEETLQWRPVSDPTPAIQSPARLSTVLGSLSALPSLDLVRTPPTRWDTPTLSQWVHDNEEALRNLTDFLEDADWHPHHAAWYASDLGSHSGWVPLGLLKQAEVAYFARRGEQFTAFNAALDLAEMSRRLKDIQAWPSYYLRSQELHQRTCESLAGLLAESRLSAPQLEAHQNIFMACSPTDDGLSSALTAFYIFEKKLLLGVNSQEPLDKMPGGLVTNTPGRLFFKPHETLHLFFDTFRELRSVVPQSPYARGSQISERLRQLGGDSWFLGPNSRGQQYFLSRLDSYLALPDQHSLALARHRIVTALFALRRYAVERRTLPASLVELQPRLLAEVPVDPYSGRNLVYDAARGLIISVGTNLHLDAGRVSEVPLADPVELVAPTGFGPQHW
jgi:hypothetical protein